MSRGRSIGVLLLVLLGGLGVISATQPWLHVEIATSAEIVPVPGADAIAVLTPLGLTVLALAGVLALVGRVLRYILAAIAAAIGLWLLAATIPLLAEPPISAVSGTVTELTGIAGADAVEGLVTGIAVTAWPAVSLVLWAALILTAGFVAASAHRWRSTGRRFRTDAAAGPGPVDAVDSWDELSRGTDPTGRDR